MTDSIPIIPEDCKSCDSATTCHHMHGRIAAEKMIKREEACGEMRNETERKNALNKIEDAILSAIYPETDPIIDFFRGLKKGLLRDPY